MFTVCGTSSNSVLLTKIQNQHQDKMTSASGSLCEGWRAGEVRGKEHAQPYQTGGWLTARDWPLSRCAQEASMGP